MKGVCHVGSWLGCISISQTIIQNSIIPEQVELTSGRVIGNGRIQSNGGIGNGNVVYGGIWNVFTRWDGELYTRIRLHSGLENWYKIIPQHDLV